MPGSRGECPVTAANTADRKTVLVASPDAGVARLLALHLGASALRIVAAAPGPSFLATARASHASIAVIDLALGREAARLMMAVLRDLWPGIRVIAVSRHPSLEDAAVVEDGVYYYLAEPPGPRLVRVVEAAARSV